MKFLEELAARRRFGMKPGLETITALSVALGDPQTKFKAIHVAGTNGKGAVAAMLDACLTAAGLRVGRYTSPHLVKLNERFFLNGRPVDDATLERLAENVNALFSPTPPPALLPEPTFFEALTAVAFLLYAEAKVDYAVLETGLGGRLDATNVCSPALTVITKIGLDHCDWLGGTIEAIAAEKAGIIKSGVPIVLGANPPEVRAAIEARAKEVSAPYYYAPELAREDEIPDDFALQGAFNRENAVTALAALKVLGYPEARAGFGRVVWPGRFQSVGSYLIDGAHNPPAARALAASLTGMYELIFGACADKDVDEVLSILRPFVLKAYAVKTTNPRSLSADALAEKMNAAGIRTESCATLGDALTRTSSSPRTLICGSLFLAGEALVALDAYPWARDRFDLSEQLAPTVANL